MRPIDADALLQKIEEWDRRLRSYTHCTDRITLDAIWGVADEIEDLDTLDYAPKQQWISVKDRLPPYLGKKILVVNGHGNIKMMAFWNKVGNNWTWLDCDGQINHVNDITHWMPLPEPPKEE